MVAAILEHGTAKKVYMCIGFIWLRCFEKMGLVYIEYLHGLSSSEMDQEK